MLALSINALAALTALLTSHGDLRSCGIAMPMRRVRVY